MTIFGVAEKVETELRRKMANAVKKRMTPLNGPSTAGHSIFIIE